MQNSRLITIEEHLKVKLLIGLIMLLLVGLHPVRVFADAANSDTTTGLSAPTTTTPPTSTATQGSSGGDNATDTSSPDTQNTLSNTSTQTSSATDSNSSSTTPPPSPAPADSQADTNSTNISNQATLTTASGDTSVSGSTAGGSATSGDAQTIATTINVLSSSTDIKNNNVNTSITNIAGNGNNQNMVIDPTTTGTSLDSQNENNTKINSANSGTIENNLTLGATTGNATVSNNDVGGNATSGNATVEADIVNITNTDFNSGQYYLGIINIYGNYSGNILISPTFVSQLLSENPSLISNNTELTNTIRQTINNQINTSATSGNANISDNAVGGNATSGNATTSIDSLDLANSSIFGNDALLVFVNVLGTWEGVIIGAPVGATTAIYGDNSSGGGIVINPSSTTTANGGVTLANKTNEKIDNTINATATTGNATVSNNDVGGNATSGNATVSVNLLNILNSDVSLAKWFGVLFINVFGNWSGSIGILTSDTTTVATSVGDLTANTSSNQLLSTVKAIVRESDTLFVQPITLATDSGQVLGTTNIIKSSPTNPIHELADASQRSRVWWLPALAGMTLASALLALEHVIRRNQQNS